MRDVSAIVLNYRTAPMTLRCVDSIVGAGREAGVDVEVVLIDNSVAVSGSELRHGVRDPLRSCVRLVENPENRGFAPAVNQGVQHTAGRFLLILNSDALITARALSTGVAYLREHPEVGLWAPKLVDEKGHAQVSCSRSPTPLSLALEYCFSVYARSGYPGLHETAAEPVAVEVAVGACWLIPRAVWDSVGPLDEGFFFTSEDTDYCRRLRDAGWKVVYDPRCTVFHAAGGSRPWAWVKDPHLHRGRLRYMRKHHGWLARAVAGVAIAVGLFLRRIKGWLRPESQRS